MTDQEFSDYIGYFEDNPAEPIASIDYLGDGEVNPFYPEDDYEQTPR